MESRKPTQPIVPDQLYPIGIAMQHLGWSYQTLRRARNCGLRSWQFGRHTFVLGSEIIRTVTKAGREKH